MYQPTCTCVLTMLYMCMCACIEYTHIIIIIINYFCRAELNPPIPRVQAKAMEAIGDAVAGGQKQEVIKPESPAMTVNIVRLLVSCLHAWNLDESLDRFVK